MMSGRENDRHLRGDWPHFRSFAKQPIITRRANNNKTRNKNNIYGQLSALQKHGTWKGGSEDDSLKSYTREETIDSRIGINSVLVPFVKIFVIYMVNVKCTHLRKKKDDEMVAREMLATYQLALVAQRIRGTPSSFILQRCTSSSMAHQIIIHQNSFEICSQLSFLSEQESSREMLYRNVLHYI